MARARNIFLVHPRGSPGVILAAFTKKYKSQNWAEAGGDIDLLERYRMKDSPAPGDPPQRTPIPWS